MPVMVEQTLDEACGLTTPGALAYDQALTDQGRPVMATCSYTGFNDTLGLPVRITLYPPRFVHLPDRRWYGGERSTWLYVPELAPQRDYFKAAEAVFDAKYLAQLEEYRDQITANLAGLAQTGQQRLVLLCFEKKVRSGHDCHRRMFAERWQQWTGAQIPEIGGGK